MPAMRQAVGLQPIFLNRYPRLAPGWFAVAAGLRHSRGPEQIPLRCRLQIDSSRESCYKLQQPHRGTK